MSQESKEKFEVFRTSTGILKYTPEPNNLKVEIDRGISDFYRSLIPKAIRPQSQAYHPHISVVRKEIVPNVNFWRKYEGEEIEFTYSNIIHFGRVYCWLNVFCKRLEEIRKELGLPVDSPYTRPPEGYFKTFHCTLGNQKKIKLWESEFD